MKYGWILCCALLWSGCGLLERLPFVPEVVEIDDAAEADSAEEIPAVPVAEESASDGVPSADVIGVAVTGAAGEYQFSVTISSPDSGCDRYADWWEVIDAEGTLLYRRVLAHSHVGEQPFTRSGGTVALEADQVVWVRAHMYPDGYGGKALQGTVTDGFREAELEAEFASELADLEPLPGDCGF